MIAKRGSVSTSSYKVSGNTLAEIDADIDKRGPKDLNDGKRYAGLSVGRIDLAIAPGDFAFAPQGSGYLIGPAPAGSPTASGRGRRP